MNESPTPQPSTNTNWWILWSCSVIIGPLAVLFSDAFGPDGTLMIAITAVGGLIRALIGLAKGDAARGFLSFVGGAILVAAIFLFGCAATLGKIN